jgi:hypothetical protein
MFNPLVIAFLWLPSLVWAAEVYRCTDPEGRVSFSQTQCHPQAHMQLHDIKPIETIKAQASNPEDLRYLEASRQRRAKERAQERRQIRVVQDQAPKGVGTKDPAQKKPKKLKKPKSGPKVRLKIPKPHHFKLSGFKRGASGFKP